MRLIIPINILNYMFSVFVRNGANKNTKNEARNKYRLIKKEYNLI